MTDLKIELSKTRKEKPDMKKVAFGTCFTDHMFIMDYTEGTGWHDHRIVPYAPFVLEPSCAVFHYAQEIFEGMKAYRDGYGDVRLFRPEENFKRMNISAMRMCIPQIDVDDVLLCLKKLIELEREWVPGERDTSLYIRPFVFAADTQINVHASRTYIFAIICCPVGSYYDEGINPVKIMIEDEDVRAVRGGTGFTKCGGNYAASIRAGARAADSGFSQVLWLDGVERRFIEEVGSMNVLFKLGDEVVTPALSGSVLPGITRKSCIELLRHWGIAVTERPIAVDELIDACASGLLLEAFGSGTAAVISPIGEISYKGKSHIIGGGSTGQLTKRLYEELTGIQWGRRPDPFGWSVILSKD